MDKRRVLIVSRSFYPINSPRSFRTTELAKELANQGHDVTVITPHHPLHSEFGEKNGIRIKKLEGYNESHFEVKRGNVSLIERVVGRIKDQYLHYPEVLIKDIVYKSLESEKSENYDLLVSIGAPHPVHWGVSKAVKKYRHLTKCWVADCGDPFMLSHNMQFKRPFYFKYLEKDFCKQADFITIPTESATDGYYPEFHNKLRVIPQGFNFEEVKLKENSGISNVIQFGYAGSLVKGRRDPTELPQYLHEKNVDFRFVVYSKNKAIVDGLVKKYPSQVIYMGEADRLEVLYHLSGLDFVLNFENLGSNQTPSKLIDYAIIKKPILSVKFGNLNKKATDEFILRNYKSQLKIENVDQYRIQNIAKKFLELSNE